MGEFVLKNFDEFGSFRNLVVDLGFFILPFLFELIELIFEMLMFGCEVFGVFDFFDVGLDLEFDGFFRGYFLRIF